MSIVLEKGVLNSGSFTSTTASWFFENPYWNNDGTKDFAIKVTNTSSSTEYLGGFIFTFQIGDSEGQSFPDSGGSLHTAAGYNCTMQVSIDAGGRSYSGTSYIEKDSNLQFHYNSSPGKSYWTPRPGPSYSFRFDELVPIEPNTDYYVHFQASFDGGSGDTNCIQISSYDSVSVLPNYTVTYKLNGGSYAGSTADYVKTVVQGGKAEPPTPVTRDSYTFNGWSPDNEDWKNVQSDLTYTAQWAAATADYAFWRNHNASDGTSIKTGTADIGTTMGSVKPINPTRPGYTFMGWSLSRTGSTVSDSTQITRTVHDFYAIWSIQFGNVVFYRNYDSFDNTVVATVGNVEYIDRTLGDTKPADPVRTCYRFLGWALSRDADPVTDSTSLWDSSQNVPRTVFYARWERVNTIWVRENGVWVKKLNVRRYKAYTNTWDEIPLKEYSNGSWIDKS